MIGGDGQDVFVFDTAPSTANRDTIHNFIVTDDTIQLNSLRVLGADAGCWRPTRS
jgi:Ca2+-binding RTX toxin-like protein